MSEEVQLSDFCEKSVNAKHTFKKIEDALYLPAPVSNGAILVIALLFIFIMRNYSNSSFQFLWSFVMASSAVYRLFLWYKRNNSSTSHSDSYWINHYALATLVVGCAWGSIFLLPYTNHDLTLYGIMLMVFFGVTAAAVPVLSISLMAFLSYTLPILICVVVFIYNLNHVVDYALMAPTIVYYIMIFLLARNSKKQLRHSINLQFQNEVLIKQLREEVVQRESLIKARTEQLEHSNQKILDSENQLQNVITGAQIGYWDWNYQTGHQVVNNRWLEILGLSQGDIENNITDWDMRIHPDDKQRMITTVEESIKKKKPFVADFRMKHKDGHWVWIQGSGSLIETDSLTQEPIRLCGTHQDISYRKEMEKELEYRAKHDYLTGLLNRVELEKSFQKELLRSQRYQHKLSVFLIDIDHFKKVNDTYGHMTGDQILKKYAMFLHDTIRNSDLVARYGGEEFVVILPETSITEAEELAERLRLKTSALNIELKDETFQISISLGIAVFPEHGQSYDQILEHADMAMYHAKQIGRNCVHTWSQ